MTPDKKRALGRGLDALLPTVAPVKTSSGKTYGEQSVFLCPIEALQPQKGQPRQRMDTEKLEELAASLREHGLIEPLVVRKSAGAGDRFEIVAGERRWRAAQRAGLKELLVVVKDISPNSAFELALIENIQREDLDPIELAEAIDRLIKEHGYTHETVAQRLHKDRTTITNALRLLKLPVRVRAMVVDGRLTEGHARALLGAPDDEAILSLADKAVRGRMTVRKVEALVRGLRKEAERQATSDGDGAAEQETVKSPNVRDIEQRITRVLGMRVEVQDKSGRGQLVIHYGSLDEFDQILRALGLD